MRGDREGAGPALRCEKWPRRVDGEDRQNDGQTPQRYLERIPETEAAGRPIGVGPLRGFGLGSVILRGDCLLLGGASAAGSTTARGTKRWQEVYLLEKQTAS